MNRLTISDTGFFTIQGGASYNNATNTLTATTFSGDLSGNATTATTATTATNATNVGITASSTNATFYPTFVSATTGNLPELVDTDLTYNPSTNTLTATTFSGALNGNATTATTATNATNATNATTATNIAGGAGGSIPYQTASSTTALLANGSAGQVLTSNGTTLAPSWTSLPSSTASTIITQEFLQPNMNKRQMITFSSTKAITNASLTATIDNPPRYARQVFTFDTAKTKRIVGVGTGGIQTIYSDDGGLTWTNGVLLNANWTAPNQYETWSVCFGATAGSVNGTWVVGGYSNTASTPIIYYSTDNGLTWSPSTLTTTQSNSIRKIIWTGSRFYAVGTNGSSAPDYISWSSTDGITWTPRLARGTIFFDIRDIAFNGSTMVIAGNSFATTPVVAYSTNQGDTFTAGVLDYGGTQGARAVVWDGEYFIIVGLNSTTPNSAFAVSRNGINWTKYYASNLNSTSLEYMRSNGSYLVSCMYFTNGLFYSSKNRGSKFSLLNIAGSTDTGVIVPLTYNSTNLQTANPYWSGKYWIIPANNTTTGSGAQLLYSQDSENFFERNLGLSSTAFPINILAFGDNNVGRSTITFEIGSTTGTISVSGGTLNTSSLDVFYPYCNGGIDNFTLRID